TCSPIARTATGEMAILFISALPADYSKKGDCRFLAIRKNITQIFRIKITFSSTSASGTGLLLQP
ncbi:hypothetical protein, partial [Pseudomonas syringae]|uniref:hypothetical protein n=1 Tax=Pseudomonas syringae TaxID=317 RepID=UPI001F204161